MRSCSSIIICASVDNFLFASARLNFADARRRRFFGRRAALRPHTREDARTSATCNRRFKVAVCLYESKWRARNERRYGRRSSTCTFESGDGNASREHANALTTSVDTQTRQPAAPACRRSTAATAKMAKIERRDGGRRRSRAPSFFSSPAVATKSVLSRARADQKRSRRRPSARTLSSIRYTRPLLKILCFQFAAVRLERRRRLFFFSADCDVANRFCKRQAAGGGRQAASAVQRRPLNVRRAPARAPNRRFAASTRADLFRESEKLAPILGE